MFKKPQQSKEEMAKIFNDAIREADSVKSEPTIAVTKDLLRALIHSIDTVGWSVIEHRNHCINWRVQSTVLHCLECTMLIIILIKLGGK